MPLTKDEFAQLLPAGAAWDIAHSVFGTTAPAATLVFDTVTERPNGIVAMATLSTGGVERNLVIKVLPPHLAEAEAYACLGAAGAPVAVLHAHFQLGQREAIVLERLPRIGHNTSEQEFATVIAALARLNVCAPVALRSTARGWVERGLGLWQSSWEQARRGFWGEAMAGAAAPLGGSWHDLGRLAQAIEAELAALPPAATHHDPCVANCGWRADGSMCFIDLGYATIHPLFTDLAIKLGSSTEPWPSESGRERWIDCYLEELTCSGGAVIPLARAARAVEVQAAALVLWLDEPTLGRAEQALTAAPPADTLHGWAGWYARTWRRLAAMRAQGIAGARAP